MPYQQSFYPIVIGLFVCFFVFVFLLFFVFVFFGHFFFHHFSFLIDIIENTILEQQNNKQKL